MTQIIILGSFYEIKAESQLVEYFPSMGLIPNSTTNKN